MNRIFKIAVVSLFCLGLFMACTGCEINRNANETEAPTSSAVTDEEGIRTQVEAYADTIEFSGMSVEEATALYNKFVANNPEYFWLSSSYTYVNNGDSVEIKIDYPYSSDKLKTMKSDLDNKVEQILLAAKARNGDFERAVFVHDYIIDNCEYATSMVDTVYNAETTHFFAENTVYGCLLGGSALCAGYAKAYCLIMKKLDYDCIVVSGDVKEDNVSHAWNVIKMDEEYYHVDVTFDDPVANGDSEKADIKSYTYFGLTTDEILENRTIDDEEEIPECTATADNYFIHEGYFLETYEFTACSDIIGKQINDGIARIKFGSESECDKAMEELFKNKKVNEIVTTSSISYFASQSVLNIVAK